MSLLLLNVLLILLGLPALVAPLAVVVFREVAPASQPWLKFVLADGGGA